MRAIEASTETAVIGTGPSGFGVLELHPDNTPHFQYISGPQALPKA